MANVTDWRSGTIANSYLGWRGIGVGLERVSGSKDMWELAPESIT